MELVNVLTNRYVDEQQPYRDLFAPLFQEVLNTHETHQSYVHIVHYAYKFMYLLQRTGILVRVYLFYSSPPWKSTARHTKKKVELSATMSSQS